MSLPRELFLKDGRLYQRPVRELDEMRRNKVEYHNVTFSDVISLNGIRGRKVDMETDPAPGGRGEAVSEVCPAFRAG